MLRRLIGEDIDIVVSARADLRTIRADPGQMEQVLMNLVVNARDAIAEGGRITIETLNLDVGEDPSAERLDLLPGSYVALVVSDNGAGMDATTKARIFEPFFTTKGPEKGTGLGLSTVYGIVQQSGGAIQVQSEPGRGTSFQLYFPALEGRAEASSTDDATEALLPGTETILVVEDQDAVAAVIRGTLEMCGYTVLTSGNGREALDLLERQAGPVQLLVTDVVLPESLGPEVAERVRERCPGIRTLYISGYTESALPVADAAFLQKPFTPLTLARKVREVLDTPRRAAA
jgi:CheY-like chemotaxis protein